MKVRRFWRAVTEPIAPASWKPELANTVWLHIQHGGLDRHVGVQRLQGVLDFGIESVDPSDLSETST